MNQDELHSLDQDDRGLKRQERQESQELDNDNESRNSIPCHHLLALLSVLMCLVDDDLRWAKTRVLKNGHARVETRILKTLACRKNVRGFFKHWSTACRCV